MWNREIASENPKGGYRWTAHLRFSRGETVLGTYWPMPRENIHSKGVLYYRYDAQRKCMAGYWVGESRDGDFCTGYSAIAHSREAAKSLVAFMMEQDRRTRSLDELIEHFHTGAGVER